MKLTELKIGDLVSSLPIIQGGMSVAVSNAPLSAAVANAGGIGLIGGTGISVDEFVCQVRKAKELSQGIIGVNIMVAIQNFLDIVKASIKENIDLVVFGAGFSRDVFSLCAEKGIPVVPIVSSLKAAKLSARMGAAAIIVEGRDAGGHLGTDKPVAELLPEIKAAVDIPVIAAGGLTDGKDIAEMIKLGADGVQLGNRFVLSDECDVHPNFKKVFKEAKKEDMVRILSPVGYPGSAVKTPFVEKFLREGKVKIRACDDCLKQCSRSFCILDHLKLARDGDIENGLFFAGRNIYKINDILPVKEIMKRLVNEANEALKMVKNNTEKLNEYCHKR